MKTNENHLIDRKALRQLREQHPELSELELAQILLADLKEELDCIAAEQREQTPVETELASLAHLRPDDEQLRRALLRLLALRDASQERPLLHKKTHWLAVCRALQHIGRISQEYGCWSVMEAFVGSLLSADAYRNVTFTSKDLSRKALDKPFHQPLSRWAAFKSNPRVAPYWEIGLRFLRLIEEEGASTAEREV